MVKQATQQTDSEQGNLPQLVTQEVTMLTSTEARKGEKVTTISRLGGVGIAFLVDGEVYRPSGSYLAVTAKSQGMVSYSRDGGEGYKQEVRRMFGG